MIRAPIVTRLAPFAPILAIALLGASTPDAQFRVTLPPPLGAEAGGRLLLFVEPATPANADADHVDVGDPNEQGVSVVARDVAASGAAHTVSIDARADGYPAGVATLPPGGYRVQAVLDRDRTYAYSGRGPGDLVSRVITIHLPLSNVPPIALDHAIPPASGQFDTTGLPPAAAQQIAASRQHLHDERIASPVLTRFHGTPQTIAAWVLTPPGYDPHGPTTYPTVFEAGGYGTDHKLDGQLLSKTWHLMETGAIPPMIWVALDYATPTGTTEFADSTNNGPWGEALVREVIPTLEVRYRMDARPTGRFLTGHSSGGWFALWTMMRHPAMFGGSWSTSPDPVDFRDFLGADIYAPGANLYHDASGAARPLERDGGAVRVTVEQQARLEDVLGHDGDGGQLRSFEWVFSPRRANGTPTRLFDRRTGKVDPAVAAYWRDHYDIGHRIEADWPRLRHNLDGKIHLRVGTADSYYLDGAVHRLEATIRKVGGHADFTYVPGATHSMAQVYAEDGDRNAYWGEMTRAMYAIARPGEMHRKPTP